MTSLIPFTQGLGHPAEEEVERLQQPEEMADTMETRPCKHSRTQANMNSQKPWQDGQSLYRSGPDEAPGLRGEVGTSSHP